MIFQGSISFIDTKFVEQVHEGIEKVDGSENIREHVIDGDSDVKEIHTVSTGDEIVEKVSFN